ncbi:MAG: pyruvate dehydrogenase E2 component (dihydrolipoamide acetyltransferase) [Alphaproteobacteria bacterium]|jgi:pyruvate dehydrogenase E2 component (dihydrolipoamide acetyltransferase)
MPIEILMPALSPTMEEGKLAAWMVKEGDEVKSGMVLAEIETDKATMEVEAIDDGRVGKILIAAGTEGVKVNTPIAVLLEDGEDATALSAATTQTANATPTPATSTSAPAVSSPAPAPNPAATPAPVSPATAAPQQGMPQANTAARLLISPLARRLAVERGLELTALTGSGPHGRIVKRDVEKAIANGSAKHQSAPEQSVARGVLTVPTTPLVEAMSDDKVMALYEEENYEIVPHDGMRRIIAQRLTQSKQTIPHFYLTIECVLDELLRARTRMNAAAPKEGSRAYKLSVNDFVIKALALGLQSVPAANASWTESGMLRHRHSDVGVAVAVEGGLFTPIIRHAEYKSLGEISNEMKELADRARKRRLAPHEYQGGTTSISNLGMFGIKSFDAVINPPHATILAVGAGEKRPIVDGDEVRVATVMSCTLSCDHRVVDGALGAQLLNAFKAYIEDPVQMLV